MRNHPKVLFRYFMTQHTWIKNKNNNNNYTKWRTATNNVVFDEKRIIKLATLMLDCEVGVVFAVAILFGVCAHSAGNGWFVCRKHTNTRTTNIRIRTHIHRVIKYKINISLTVCFRPCLFASFSISFRKLQQQHSWIGSLHSLLLHTYPSIRHGGTADWTGYVRCMFCNFQL